MAPQRGHQLPTGFGHKNYEMARGPQSGAQGSAQQQRAGSLLDLAFEYSDAGSRSVVIGLADLLRANDLPAAARLLATVLPHLRGQDPELEGKLSHKFGTWPQPKLQLSAELSAALEMQWTVLALQLADWDPRPAKIAAWW